MRTSFNGLTIAGAFLPFGRRSEISCRRQESQVLPIPFCWCSERTVKITLTSDQPPTSSLKKSYLKTTLFLCDTRNYCKNRNIQEGRGTSVSQQRCCRQAQPCFQRINSNRSLFKKDMSFDGLCCLIIGLNAVRAHVPIPVAVRFQA